MCAMRFPLFIDLRGRPVVVIGGGAVALRRVRALVPFGPELRVIAPTVLPELETLPCRLECRPFAAGDTQGAFLVLAATDCPSLNARICREARENGAWANNASCREDCDFYFPGLVVTEDLVYGFTGTGENHKALRSQINKIKEVLQ